MDVEDIEPRLEMLLDRIEGIEDGWSRLRVYLEACHTTINRTTDELFKANIRIAQLDARVRQLEAPKGGMPGGSASGVPSLPVSKNADAHRPAPSHSPAKKLGSPSPNGFTADSRD